MERDVPVFEAARALWVIRNSAVDKVSGSQCNVPPLTHPPQKTRMCTPRQQRPSHQTPHGAYINCKGCHAAKCFNHILDGCVHASEAILAASADPESTTWHGLHQVAKNRQIRVVPGPSGTGGVPQLRIRLVYYALNFACSHPPKSWMTSGFYDVPAASIIVLSDSCLAHVCTQGTRNIYRKTHRQVRNPIIDCKFGFKS